MCIFELSKVSTYQLHYDYIKNIYGNSSRLLFTDPDSLMYDIKTENVHKDFRNDREMFDSIIQPNQNIMIIQKNYWVDK